MKTLDSLKDTHRKSKKANRVGRGTGSGSGKTCGRGHKGAGSRSGSKMRYGYEGGQFPLYMKLPIRGFSNARFQKKLTVLNLRQINEMFKDGDTVNELSLREHGFISGKCNGLKILGDGDLKVKVSIEADAFSKGAIAKLESENIKFSVKKK